MQRPPVTAAPAALLRSAYNDGPELCSQAVTGRRCVGCMTSEEQVQTERWISGRALRHESALAGQQGERMGVRSVGYML